MLAKTNAARRRNAALICTASALCAFAHLCGLCVKKLRRQRAEPPSLGITLRLHAESNLGKRTLTNPPQTTRAGGPPGHLTRCIGGIGYAVRSGETKSSEFTSRS